MTTIEELRAALAAAQTGSPEASVESAIAVYQAAMAAVDAFGEVKDEARRLITDVMAETGVTRYATRAGSASVTAPGVSVSYDSKALDALVMSNDVIRRLLEPHRKVTERAGTLRITGAK